MFNKSFDIHYFFISAINTYKSWSGTKIRGGASFNWFSIINVFASAFAPSATSIRGIYFLNSDTLYDALRDLYTFIQPDWHAGGYVFGHPTTTISSTSSSVAIIGVVTIIFFARLTLSATSMDFFLSCWSTFLAFLCFLLGRPSSLVAADLTCVFESFRNFNAILFNSKLFDCVHVGYILRTPDPF